MNMSDSEIVRSILVEAGHKSCADVEQADLILTNTCAIRENAEAKVWNRIKYFNSLKLKNRHRKRGSRLPMVGILGCMAGKLVIDSLA